MMLSGSTRKEYMGELVQLQVHGEARNDGNIITS